MNTSPSASDALASGLPFFNGAVGATVVQIKATKGKLYFLDLVNSAAANSFLQIFFLPKASVILGTTAADLVIQLASTAGQGFARTIPLPVPVGEFLLAGGPGSGLSVAGTTTATGAAAALISVAAVFR